MDAAYDHNVATRFGRMDVALAGGVTCGPRIGPFAGVGGTLFPSGVAIASGPLADAAAFQLDPVVRSQAAGRRLASGLLGVATVEVGFRGRW